MKLDLKKKEKEISDNFFKKIDFPEMEGLFFKKSKANIKNNDIEK